MTPKQQQEINTMTKMYQKTTCLTDKEKQEHIEEATAKIMNNVEIRNLAIKLQTHFLGRNIFISDEECVLAVAMLERTKAEESQHRDERREGSFALGLQESVLLQSALMDGRFSMSEELKPCPFCGGQASERNSQHAEGKMPWPTELWHVGCDACHVYFMGGSQVSIAKDRWNTRTPDAGPQDARFDEWSASVKDCGHEVQPNSATARQRWLGWRAASANHAADLAKILYPNGCKHPQQREWNWLLERVKELQKL